MDYLKKTFAALSLPADSANDRPPDAASASATPVAHSGKDSTTVPGAEQSTALSDHILKVKLDNESGITPSTPDSSDSDIMKRPRDDNEHDASNIILKSLPDPIIELLHEFIQEERKRNFLFLANRSHCYMNQEDLLVVSPADREEISAIRNRAGYTVTASYETHWYTFTPQPLMLSSLRRTVVIETPLGHEPTIDNMKLSHFSNDGEPYRMSPATTWLRDTYDWDTEYEMRFPAMQYDEQRWWWDSNGMAFRLLDLPAEMRDAIYFHIIGPIVLPDFDVYPQDKFVLGVGRAYKDKGRSGRNRDPDVERPNITIMLVNKQVREEATTIAYRDTTKRFCALRAWGEYSENLEAGPATNALIILSSAQISSPHAMFLRDVQLEMSAAMYFRFIGISPTRRKPMRTNGGTGTVQIKTLEAFTALRHLDFRFISPKHQDAVCPWVLPIGGQGNDTHSCQKLWIHWFFIFAWKALSALNETRKDIQGAKSITYSLSGCVKHSTRTYWESVLNDKRVDHSATIKVMAQQIRQNKTDDGPIPCKCTNSCAKTDGPGLFQVEEHEVRLIEGLQEEMDKVYWDFED